jgi:hypothetical protein
LAEQHGQAATVTLAAPESGLANSGWSQAQNMNQGSGQDQRDSQGAYNPNQTGAQSGTSNGSGQVSAMTPASVLSINAAIAGTNSGGMHISVIA